MTQVTLVNKDDNYTLEDVENVVGPRPNVPYWEISYSKEEKAVRHFFHVDSVREILIEGEEELIEKAKGGRQDNKAFMQEILER